MGIFKEVLSRLRGDAADYTAAGVDLADLLERRPDCVEPIVNERVRAYHYLAMMRRILQRFDINVIIDAGAHSGQFAGPMYGFCGFQGKIHSFEPVEAFYGALQADTKYCQGWSAYNLAVGDVRIVRLDERLKSDFEDPNSRIMLKSDTQDTRRGFCSRADTTFRRCVACTWR